jgi:hypothetical protein
MDSRDDYLGRIQRVIDHVAAHLDQELDRPCVEEYLNDPRQVPAHQLRTTVWLPLR